MAKQHDVVEVHNKEIVASESCSAPPVDESCLGVFLRPLAEGGELRSVSLPRLWRASLGRYPHMLLNDGRTSNHGDLALIEADAMVAPPRIA